MTAPSPSVVRARLLVRLSLLASAAVVLLPAVAIAQTPTPAQPVATADGEGAGDAPVALDPVTLQGAAPAAPGALPSTTTDRRETLDRAQVRSLTDLARRESGISFNRRTNSVNIRGLEGPRVLTTIDGIRIPYLQDGARQANGGTDSFDFDSLSTLDLMRGADSSTFGSGALGGVVAVRTLDPEDLLPGDKTLGVLTKTGFDTVDRSWFSNAAVATRVADTFLLVQGGYRRGHETDNQGTVGGVGPTRSEPNPQDYDQVSGLAKLRQHFDGGHVVGLTGEIFDRDQDFDGRTTQTLAGNFRPGGYRNGEAVERQRVSLDYAFDAPEDALLDAARAVVYWQRLVRTATVDAYRSTSVIGPFTRENDVEDTGFGFNGDATARFETGAVRHAVTAGLDLFAGETTQYSAGRDSCPATGPYTGRFFACNNLHTNQADMPTVDSRSVGVFVQDEIGFLDGHARLTPGLRFDWYSEDPKLTRDYADSAAFTGALPPSSSDWALSPKLLAEYDVTDALTVYAQYAAGFRAPTVNELYLRFGAVGTYLRTGNPDLEPETSDGFEVGARFDGERVDGRIAVFDTRYENFIDTVQIAPPGGLYPQAGITGYENIANARIYGIEASASVDIAERWHAFASLAFQRGTNEDTGAYLDSIPPLQAVLGLGYATETWGVDVSTKLAAARDDVNTGFKAPGYGVVDLTGWWEPEQVKGLKIAAGVYNLFDQTYYDALNVPDPNAAGRLAQPVEYYSEPGRSFKLTATYAF
ncbi:TonB-dependent hemoglobin/transferrin/lactoferrin family receptor [Chthonobacter rhizosphaerae]|uniref:TonB-dependent hemoglobin/transferrin/lactoferrin family receptor n=1 Tax=Chthonobacter rhizosphaerae TaxID=2735553 RepID=UPI0015EEBCC6|nr:TonB-dependent hemoglobin/transferrin/lactoferrin family receptor [Chthonobacter rhizosphaerae]